MLYLLAGSEPERKIDLLLSLTRITSEPTIAALKLHYTTGLDAERCSARHFIELSNLNRAQSTLNSIMGVIEAIKEIDLEKHLAKLAAANARITEIETQLASYQLTDSREHAA
ncbi:hypothetical protein B4P00_20330 [Shewanella xiamenensis]|nr:hypothetical protein [Shewanella xiamenensis]